MELDGARVVVTGGSDGIGAGLAAAFAERGAHVMVVARTEHKLRAVADRLVGDHLVADLTDADDVDTLVARCVDRLGHVDIWVNNAGVETNQSLAATPRDDIRALVRLNVEAAFLLTRDVLDHMLPRGSGHIVQMASVAGAVPFPGLTAYAGSKAALTHFTESLRLELKGTGIGLTVVSPGPVETAMWDRLEDADNDFAMVGLRRFKHLGFLPKLDVGRVVDATVGAVERDRRFVRLPRRYTGYHLLSNAPRRLVEAALIGTRFPRDWEETSS